MKKSTLALFHDLAQIVFLLSISIFLWTVNPILATVISVSWLTRHFIKFKLSEVEIKNLEEQLMKYEKTLNISAMPLHADPDPNKVLPFSTPTDDTRKH